ncbi:DNA cytosine methyltransferase [Microbulbifer thermotolerans]|uniref:Cytosine-specific methyltransferase n=1 Tax=Microbulbifer thermotolerans TaxID=252514 RepID=A0A143HJQ2_MICTH|nr:DNA cytosine methyltransferase [Microbulbifer thermotolerans]AMX01502.1 cytosine methyltransferase [Microbulbifer thermotolerans]
MKFNAIDLFCGAGGLTVGLQKAGFEVLAGVEINKNAAETYRLNHPNHVLYEKDICELTPQNIIDDLGIKKGNLDLLAGCPPCQGFSRHRTRNKSVSVDDARNELIFEFIRFVEGLLPKTIMMENVPGLYKDPRMKLAIKKLKALDYQFSEQTLAIRDAADFGVPQRRKRMILMASRFGIIEEPQKDKKPATVRDFIYNLKKSGESGDFLHDWQSKRTEKVNKIISLVPKNGGSRSDIPKRYWLDCHKKNPDSYKDVYGRMCWDSVAPTITGGCHNPSKGRFIHPEEDRAISLREAALLQTFPKRYKFSVKGGKDSVALMIGNALPPKFIKRQAEMIYKHLKEIFGEE